MTATDHVVINYSRRHFLQMAAGFSALTLGQPLFAKSIYVTTSENVLLSARNDSEGRHWCVGYRLDGQEVFRTKIPLRAHDIVLHPAGSEVLFIARRPGTQCYWLDSRNGQILSVIEARKDRHFYGHGVFDPTGEWLYLTENDTRDPGRGVLGVYRYRKHELKFETELSTHGIGPHQLTWIPGTETLAIANGGLRTEADSRENLNMDAMESSLVIVDRQGKLLSKDILSEQYSSIRHVAACADGTLVTGQQYMGAADDNSTLIAIKRPGKKLEAFPMNESQSIKMNQYSASITVHQSLGLMAATAPRGNRVMVWDLASAKNLLDLHFPDCAGVAATEDGFIVSSGLSGCLRLRYYNHKYNQKHDQKITTESLLLPSGGWDNHLVLTQAAV